VIDEPFDGLAHGVQPSALQNGDPLA
jgi:hypothetical protein